MSTVIIHNHRVSYTKIKQFHEILHKTGGRYTHGTPIYLDKHILCNYEHDNFEEFISRWNLVNQEIKETHKDQKWRIILRRIKNVFHV